MRNARLIIAIVTSVLYELVIVSAIIWGLPRLGINIPIWGIVIIVLFFASYAVVFYKIGSRVLKKEPLPGLPDMIGTEGKVTTSLTPVGFVKIKGEFWEARAQNGNINAGTEVIVISQDGLKIIVRRK